MNATNYLFVVLILLIDLSVEWNRHDISAYHFHTYFDQNREPSIREAIRLREQTQLEINSGSLRACRLNTVNYSPIGPHPTASYETCCNKSSLANSLSWFMQNHNNLTVLFHPLTRWEVLDHTERAMFLGPNLTLNLSALVWDLGEPDKCLPLTIGKSEL